MNRLLILSSLAILILEVSSASEAGAYSAAMRHWASVAPERHAAQSHSVDRDIGGSCITRLFVMTKSDGSRTIRKSVDCEE
jgi:hypothetical protein